MGLRDLVYNWLFPQGVPENVKRIDTVRSYRTGVQRPQLKVKYGQVDDNVAINLIGLIVNRSVSSLFGNGFDVTFPEGADKQRDYIQDVLDANHEEILFHRIGLFGAEAGTCYLKIVPGEGLPRLIAVDPSWVEITTDPNDYEKVTKYTIQYATGDTAHREVIEGMGGSWLVTDYISTAKRAEWVQTAQETWPYSWSPLQHWQNLPSNGAYGEPDITDDVIGLQDKINFVTANTLKIVRYYAHPMRIGRNIQSQDVIDMGPDRMVRISGADAGITQLEQLGDLSGSLAVLTVLRQSMFDVTRTIDITSMSDKLGSLTNFGMRVLFRDAIAKIETKRELYGDAIGQLVEHLLELEGMQLVDYVVVWPDVLDTNTAEEIQALQADMAAGALSVEGYAEARGINFDMERERLEKQKQGEDNIGSLLLSAFNKGQ